MSNELERAKRTAELAQERVALLERLSMIRKEFADLIDDDVSAAVDSPPDTPVLSKSSGVRADTPSAVPTGDAPRRRGRPPGSGKKDTVSITVIGKQAAKEESQKDLPSLLTHIAETENRPLKLADFVQLARRAGYNTTAKDFPNMVYQALLKLVKRKVLEKDQTTRDYHYVGKAA
jgi:hypothetical protein